jgi:manganese transport protein
MVSLPEVHRNIVAWGHGSLAQNGRFRPRLPRRSWLHDPGNWATDCRVARAFGYTLLAVVLISNFMAILLQHLCVKLGIATARSRAGLPRSLRYANHLVSLGHLRTGHCGVRSR